MARPKGSGAFAVSDKEANRLAWEQCNHARLLRGELSWSDLSDAELEYGAGYSPGGHHSHVKQVFGELPPKLARELVRERHRRAFDNIQKYAFASVEVVADVMQDFDQPGGVRLKAAQVLQDRAWGQSPQVVAVTDDTDKLEELLSAVLADGGDPELSRIERSLTFGKSDMVIPGEVVDE